MKLHVASSLILLLLFSCTQESIETTTSSGGYADAPLNEATLFIDKEPLCLSPDDAKNVAVLFCSGNKTGSRANDINPSDVTVQTVMDSTLNVPLLYIVNYKDGKGYAIISANKKNAPILAYADEGNFKLGNDPGSTNYLEIFKAQSKDAHLDTSDSLRIKHALEWAVFEKAEQTNTRASNTDIQQMIQKEIDRKTKLGYTYIGTITSASAYLSDHEYQLLLKDISTHSDPNYNYQEVSLFFIKKTTTEIGPLIGTKWHQDEPFNVDAPNKLAGCVPIAVGQIVYYYKYPAKYDWSQIYLYPVLNEAFKYFITDIRNLCDVEYKPGGTGSNYKKVLKAFSFYLGYRANDNGIPDNTKLRNEVTAKRPVFICGENETTGHAWVCEGYQSYNYLGSISMIGNRHVLPTGEGPYSDYTVHIHSTPSLNLQEREFYYMNMGWGGLNNGWYRSNTDISNPEINFPKSQKIITVKRP